MKIFAATASLIIILLMPNVSVADGDVSVTIPISVNVSASNVVEQQFQDCTISPSSQATSQATSNDTPDKITCESDLIDYQSVESNGQEVVLVIPL